MNQTDDWTPEERAALRHLLGTDGWLLVLRHVLLPQVQQLTAMLDRPAIDQQGHGDYLRGQKRASMALLDTLYRTARLPNPLDTHALGLLRAVGREPAPAPEVLSPAPTPEPEKRYGRQQPV